MPWKPEVYVGCDWYGNSLVFATREEAEIEAHALFMRWTLCEDSRAVEVDETPNAVRNEHGWAHLTK
jgi:hypothetical protein